MYSAKEPQNNSIHVYPVWQDHDTFAEFCWCAPVIEIQPNGVILVIHNEAKEC